MKLILVAFCLCLAGCATTSEGRGVAQVEKMSEKKFETLVKAVKFGAKEGMEELIEREYINQNQREIISDIAIALQNIANSTFSETTTHIITETVAAIPSLQEFQYKNSVMAVMEFVENRISKRGASFVILENGKFAMSARTRILILAISDGLIEAIGD